MGWPLCGEVLSGADDAAGERSCVRARYTILTTRDYLWRRLRCNIEVCLVSERYTISCVTPCERVSCEVWKSVMCAALNVNVC